MKGTRHPYPGKCMAGVPHDNPQFIPVPQGRLCGTINVNDKGEEPRGGWRFKSILGGRWREIEKEEKKKRKFYMEFRSFKKREPHDPVTEKEKMWRRKFADIIRGVLPFVNPRTLARYTYEFPPWLHDEIVAQPHYQDMHQFKVIAKVQVRD